MPRFRTDKKCFINTGDIGGVLRFKSEVFDMADADVPSPLPRWLTPCAEPVGRRPDGEYENPPNLDINAMPTTLHALAQQSGVLIPQAAFE